MNPPLPRAPLVYSYEAIFAAALREGGKVKEVEGYYE